MSSSRVLVGFAAVVAGVFGVSLLVGRAVGPLADPPTSHATGAHAGAGTHTGTASTTAELPGGLMSAQDGYTLTLGRTTLPAGSAVPVSLTITGPDGSPVTAFDVVHGKALHLIAVRRDVSGFQHVHPSLSRGVWSTTLDLTPGVWRVFADMTPTGAEALKLGTDLMVPGQFQPVLPPEDSRTDLVAGYTVTLDGDLEPGTESAVAARVSKDGEPVTDLQPYLGAAGHLVALRDGDLAYLHVHPEGGTTAGPGIPFRVEVPSAARYHLFLSFRHDGVVRTASFTLPAA